MANDTSEVMWIHNVLKFLKVPIPTSHMYCDNQIALHICTNPIFHECTKHIEIDCHFVRDYIVSGGYLSKIHSND